MYHVEFADSVGVLDSVHFHWNTICIAVVAAGVVGIAVVLLAAPVADFVCAADDVDFVGVVRPHDYHSIHLLLLLHFPGHQNRQSVRHCPANCYCRNLPMYAFHQLMKFGFV